MIKHNKTNNSHTDRRTEGRTDSPIHNRYGIWTMRGTLRNRR